MLILGALRDGDGDTEDVAVKLTPKDLGDLGAALVQAEGIAADAEAQHGFESRECRMATMRLAAIQGLVTDGNQPGESALLDVRLAMQGWEPAVDRVMGEHSQDVGACVRCYPVSGRPTRVQLSAGQIAQESSDPLEIDLIGR